MQGRWRCGRSLWPAVVALVGCGGGDKSPTRAPSTPGSVSRIHDHVRPHRRGAVTRPTPARRSIGSRRAARPGRLRRRVRDVRVAADGVGAGDGAVLGPALHVVSCGPRDGGRTWVGIPAPPAELARDRPARAASAASASPTPTTDGRSAPTSGRPTTAAPTGASVTLPGVDAGSAGVRPGGGAPGRSTSPSSIRRGVRILTSPVGADALADSPHRSSRIGGGPRPPGPDRAPGRHRMAGRGRPGRHRRGPPRRRRLGPVGAAVPRCRRAGRSWPPPPPTDLVAVCDEGEWNDTPPAVRAYVVR